MMGFGSLLYSQTLPPVKLSARPVDENKILIEWEKPTSYQATIFKVYRSIHDTVSLAYIGFTPGNQNSYLDHNLQIGVNYTYSVVAIKENGSDTITSFGNQLVTTQAISGTDKVQISSIPNTYAKVNEVYSVQLIGISKDINPILRYSIISAPKGMTIDSINGKINWVPSSSGRFNVTVNVKNINDINHIELGSPIPQTTYRFTLQVASKTSSLCGNVKTIINSSPRDLHVKIFQVTNDEFTYETVTNDSGNFYFNNISAGDYYVYIKDNIYSYESKWYPDAKDFSNAKAVSCNENEKVTINFLLNLEKVREKDKISGNVKDINGMPINNANVMFYDASRFINIGLENANIEDIIDQKNVNFVASGTTNSKGDYSANLQRGKYYFAICRADGFNYMFYNNQTSLIYANKIYVNNDRGGVDFTMIYTKNTSNQLKGQVLKKDTYEGIESRIIVTKKQEDERGGGGLKVPFRGVPSDIYITFRTESNGSFEIENLDTTMYWVQAIPMSLNAYLPTYYSQDNSAIFNWYDADSIYTFGTISNINLYSAPIMNDGVGTIIGKVTAPPRFGESLRGVIVYAKLNENVVAYTITDSLGNYLIKGLRSGTYTLFADFLGFETSKEINVNLDYNNALIVKDANIALDVYEFNFITKVPKPDPFLPISYSISQNYPNPFNPSTTIEYKLEKESFVELKIYDVLGREVEKLISGTQNAGTHKVQFKANNLASGIYFASIKVQNDNKVVYLKYIKMLLAK
jgi:hypothetical protein